MIRRVLLVLALGSLLTACGQTATPAPTVAVQQPTAAPTTAAPTTAPTAQPPAVTAAPTSEPAPAGALPATLYVLEGGQVVRIDVDGTTKTTLTDEQPFTPGALAITEVAVSPADGALAYVLQGTNGNTLVMTDANGKNRRVLLENQSVASPRWSRDGSAVAVQVGQPSASDTPWKSGVWVFSAFSGEARQLIASDPAPTDDADEAWIYAPEAWSPDGRKLLIGRFSQMVELCDAAIVDVLTGELTTLQPLAAAAAPLRVQCAGGVWAADSSGVYVVLRGPGLSAPEPGLYLANAEDGTLSPVISAQPAAEQLALVQSQSIGPDGALYALIALVERIPGSAAEPNAPPPLASLYRVGQDGKLERLRPDSFGLFGSPIWAPGGVGAVLPTAANEGGVTYLYVPISGEAVRLQFEPTAGIAWGV
jgi:dipeptidyl aminopeptidase/acylaminoacyl peptidase